MGGSRRDVRIREIIYDPLTSQNAFHKCAARYKGYSGPIGSGKSQALCQETIRLTYLNPGRTGLLGAPTYPMLRDATQATLFEILNANRIPYDHNKAENALVMTDTGSRILFRPVDDFERLRGTNLAWFGLDELTYTQEEAWLRLEGRLRDPKATRLCGFAAWTPKGYDWVYRKFLAKAAADYQTILAGAGENRHLLQRDPEFYTRLQDSYDEKFYAQEVLGQYLNQDGSRVYSSFVQKDHVGEGHAEPPEASVVGVGFQRGPDEFGGSADRGRPDQRAGRDCDPARDDSAGVQDISRTFSPPRGGSSNLWGRLRLCAADFGNVGLRHGERGARDRVLARCGHTGPPGQSAGAGPDSSGKHEAEIGQGRYRDAGRPEVQGTDHGFRTGEL